ncbi:MAG: hypothetical protein B193_1309 [Solidesulfovibrio magneticus str. Maddingley MBC34]|uniref:Uncharacterized protein n=1 Tax=Solidesulfovibrio magneticus str. Maddingley MBC34 TaxID=1206767 RepID=K6GFX8_9BACT|nr:MAG: hypothetical protein B193_1309 [Solidesulfovibrio magneticus str. Maddingley MBC34]
MHPRAGQAAWPRPDPLAGPRPGLWPRRHQAVAALARMLWGMWLLLALLAPSVASGDATVDLSPPEARYVAERGVVTLCVDPD